MSTSNHPDLWNNGKIKFTDLGGLAIRMENQTGETSVKGKLVDPHPTIDGAVTLVPVGMPDIIGVIEEDGIPVGGQMWVVVQGIAYALFAGNTTTGQFARMTIAADTGDAPGVAIAEALPTAPFATDKHFQEIGHVIESRTGAGLAKVVLHFN